MGNFSRSFFLFIVIALTGCANHPLPSDRMKLSSYDIVHKVRCEAREALDAHSKTPEFARILAEIPALDKEMAARKKRVSQLNKQLAALVGPITTINEEISRVNLNEQLAQRRFFGTTKPLLDLLDELKAAPSNGARHDRIAAKIKALLRERDGWDVALRRLRVEKKYVADKAAKQKTAKEKIEKKAKNLAKTIGKSEKLYNKLLKNVLDFKAATVAMIFTLDIKETNDATTKGAVTWPIGLGTLKLSYDAKDKKQRQSIRSVKIASTFNELMELDCTDAKLGDRSKRAKRYPLRGNIGIGGLVEQYLRLIRNSNLSADKEAFRDRLIFTTEFGGSLTPSWVLKTAGGVDITGDIDFDASRVDKHEVIVEIAPKKPGGGDAKTKVTPLIIDKLPDINVRPVHGDLHSIYSRAGPELGNVAD